MDMFDSSDDEEQVAAAPLSSHEELSHEICNAVYIELMKLKPKVPVTAMHDTNIIIGKEIVVLLADEGSNISAQSVPTNESVRQLQTKIQAAKITNVTYCTVREYLEASSSHSKFDIVVCLFEVEGQGAVRLYSQRLLPKGTFISYGTSEVVKRQYGDNDWIVDSAVYRPILNKESISLVCINKRAARRNQAGALYWPALRSAEHAAQERKLIEDITVTLSAQELRTGTFSTTTHENAVRIMHQHGVCIFPQLFPASEVLQWGEAARHDMKDVIQTLRDKHHVDLLAGVREGEEEVVNVVKDNFHELSMREAYRCDLRNSPRLKAMHAELELPKTLPNTTVSTNKADEKKASNAGYVSTSGAAASLASAVPTADSQTKSARIHAAVERCVANRVTADQASNGTSPELRYHRGLLAVLTDIMNPLFNPATSKSTVPSEVNIEHGNWGKWNFNGPGPGALNAPCVGKMGAVVSLPGCTDQTIHADTPHIFEHVHLPGHYLNLFLPCVMPRSGADVPIAASTLVPADPARTLAIQKAISDAKAKDAEEVYVDEATELRELVCAATGEEKSECFLQGQTAFVVGSHRMSVAAVAMTDADAQPYLEARLVRPHLSAGDALLFDTRILHFGLSNWSHLAVNDAAEKDWRMMLYINYHQQWFNDPKNWNDNAKLF
eukprot:gene23523-26628_t